jgi:SpoVK/Ycf46/Vps4 family AAA+-type ATPase
MREVVELPMLHPERFVALGIDPPKGVLCYGPPGASPIMADVLPANPVSDGALIQTCVLYTEKYRCACI